MKYVKTVSNYEIFEASKEECDGMRWKYPCFLAFYNEYDDDDFDLRAVLEHYPDFYKLCQVTFPTLEEAEKYCRSCW